ncbi:MAG: alanine:cation symporter family protein, partial [Clostridia bacterium]|nr:alanine:cation symporter family protein [Clostridia bacterium]
DVFNGLMAIPNLIGITFLSKDVLKITENYLQRRKGKAVSPLLNIYDTY